LFSKSAIKRIGRDRFVRNVMMAIGNSGDRELLPVAEARMTDSAPLVRGAAIWALGRLDRNRLAMLATQLRTQETDITVASEWAQALGELAA
jgi:epoxyqueuosine reductase